MSRHAQHRARRARWLSPHSRSLLLIGGLAAFVVLALVVASHVLAQGKSAHDASSPPTSGGTALGVPTGQAESRNIAASERIAAPATKTDPGSRPSGSRTGSSAVVPPTASSARSASRATLRRPAASAVAPD